MYLSCFTKWDIHFLFFFFGTYTFNFAFLAQQHLADIAHIPDTILILCNSNIPGYKGIIYSTDKQSLFIPTFRFYKFAYSIHFIYVESHNRGLHWLASFT